MASREEHEARRRAKELEWRQLSLAKRRSHENRRLLQRFGATDDEIERFYNDDDDSESESEADTIQPDKRLVVIHKHENDSWLARNSGLALSLGLIAAFAAAGFIIYLVMRNRRHRQFGDGGDFYPFPQQNQQPIIVNTPAQQPQLYLINGSTGQTTTIGGNTNDQMLDVLKRIEGSLGKPPRLPREPFVQTVRLPDVHDPNAQQIRVCQATDVPYRATLRVVGPAGTYAIFTTVPGMLDRPDIANVVPASDALIVPSGQWHELQLNPRQAVFAKGSAPNVLVSATASEAMEYVY